MKLAAGVIILILLNTNVALSQQAAARAQQKKKTAINFEDQLVQGEVRKPELFYLLQKKQFNFGRLIKMRENFIPEMRRTSEDVQRGGGGEAQ